MCHTWDMNLHRYGDNALSNLGNSRSNPMNGGVEYMMIVSYAKRSLEPHAIVLGFGQRNVLEPRSRASEDVSLE